MRTKKDISGILGELVQIASYDSELQKYYIVFEDRKRGGLYTLMKKVDQWSVHGRGVDYCDNGETFLTEKETVDFLWIHRAAFRQAVLAVREAAEDEHKGNVG